MRRARWRLRLWRAEHYLHLAEWGGRRWPHPWTGNAVNTARDYYQIVLLGRPT